MGLEAANDADAEEAGLFEPRRLAFIESIADLRPRMHRYCARMTGSALDGEDVMQEAIFDAYLKLASFDASRPLGPWLFRIAHNRCIDFLRRRQARRETEAAMEPPAWIDPPEAVGRAIDRAIERLVIALPPKERACVLLKDVFDYSLEDIADLVEFDGRRRQSGLKPRPRQAGRADRCALPEAEGERSGTGASSPLCRPLQPARLARRARTRERRRTVDRRRLLRRTLG